MRKILTLIIILLLAFASYSQQDAQFSQYMFNGLYINPAYAGYKEQANIHSFYRTQWVGFEGAPQTMSVAGDLVLKDGNVGLGLLLSNDFTGSQSSFSTYINYAYRIQIGESGFSRLSFGLAAGLVQQGIDGDKLSSIEVDQYVPTGKPTESFPDARVGIFYSTPSLFVGFSADNLVASYFQAQNHAKNLLLMKINKHYYFTAGALIPINYDIKFKPTVLLKDDAQTFTSMDINAFLLLYDRIWIGGFYRTAVKTYKKPHLDAGLQKKNGIGVIGDFFINENLRLGYAFDYSLSNLRSYNYGSHEISIGFALSPRRREGPKCYF
ncbi:MAG: type IX secretion system membrane protein PorP/SprF [Sphingobacteriaceae bacterium]|nr:type IX secretion system membrane protein PorP/SprF [Sphingobacteriaceae bacterium]